MREAKIIALIATLLFSGSLRAHSEECDTLRDATPDALVSYLQTVAPDQENAECVTFAINKLGNQCYEPAISALTRLLDFRRPLSPREKQGLYLRIQIVEEIYPAANALEVIGRKALPALLELIKAESTSDRARENAVAVWMELYKDLAPQGVALLRHGENAGKRGDRRDVPQFPTLEVKQSFWGKKLGNVPSVPAFLLTESVARPRSD